MRARVRNLTFHGVGERSRVLMPGEAAVWLSAPRFEAVLDSVRGREDVRLSFDDSNRSDVDVALPALLERGLRATFFVLAGRLEWDDHLGVDDLARLEAAGMRVGSHGLLHRDWRRLTDSELTEEVVRSREILQSAVRTAVDEVSVPFGSYDRRVLACVRRDGGYARVFTSDGGTARPRAWLQPRTSITASDDQYSVRSTGAGPLETVIRTGKRVVKRWR